MFLGVDKFRIISLIFAPSIRKNSKFWNNFSLATKKKEANGLLNNNDYTFSIFQYVNRCKDRLPMSS